MEEWSNVSQDHWCLGEEVVLLQHKERRMDRLHKLVRKVPLKIQRFVKGMKKNRQKGSEGSYERLEEEEEQEEQELEERQIKRQNRKMERMIKTPRRKDEELPERERGEKDFGERKRRDRTRNEEEEGKREHEERRKMEDEELMTKDMRVSDGRRELEDERTGTEKRTMTQRLTEERYEMKRLGRTSVEGRRDWSSEEKAILKKELRKEVEDRVKSKRRENEAKERQRKHHSLQERTSDEKRKNREGREESEEKEEEMYLELSMEQNTKREAREREKEERQRKQQEETQGITESENMKCLEGEDERERGMASLEERRQWGKAMVEEIKATINNLTRKGEARKAKEWKRKREYKKEREQGDDRLRKRTLEGENVQEKDPIKTEEDKKKKEPEERIVREMEMNRTRTVEKRKEEGEKKEKCLECGEEWLPTGRSESGETTANGESAGSKRNRKVETDGIPKERGDSEEGVRERTDLKDGDKETKGNVQSDWEEAESDRDVETAKQTERKNDKQGTGEINTGPHGDVEQTNNGDSLGDEREQRDKARRVCGEERRTRSYLEREKIIHGEQGTNSEDTGYVPSIVHPKSLLCPYLDSNL